MVAGGRRNHRKAIPLIFSTLKRVRDLTLPRAHELAPSSKGADRSTCSAGLRFASTSGYFLTTLRVANTSASRYLRRISLGMGGPGMLLP